MGFWDTVGKVANAGLEKVKEVGEEANKKYDRYERYSDKELLRQYKYGNMTDKMAIGKLLEERGYKRNNN